MFIYLLYFCYSGDIFWDSILYSKFSSKNSMYHKLDIDIILGIYFSIMFYFFNMFLKHKEKMLKSRVKTIKFTVDKRDFHF